MSAIRIKPGLALCFALIAALLLHNAWVADDAYITFRVVDNALHGFGLRWNIDERVQVYTHPLWMLAHIPLYALTGNIFLTTIAFSLGLTLLGLWRLLACVPAGPWHKTVLLLLPFALSKTLRDHSISGLETPMLLCLMAFVWHALLHAPSRPGRIFLMASLVLLTRLDMGLMLILPLLWLLKQQSWRRRLQALTWLWPLAAWFGFSLFYYGFCFPNTKYAKLNTGIALRDYMAQGSYYLRDFFSYDLFSASILCLALLATVAAIMRKAPGKSSDLITLNAFGILLYLMYIIIVGGDFMAGRFLAVPVFAALLLLMQLGHALPTRRLPAIAAGMLALGGVQAATYVPRDIPQVIAHHGIADEREFYKDTNALFIPATGALRTGVTLSQHNQSGALAASGVVEQGFTGVNGFIAGPALIIIDWNALSDPLLARLPIHDPKIWRIGHFEREIPPGYMHARKTGDMSQMPESLRGYYQPLRIITTASLWAPERLKTILWFNLGYYDGFRKAYLESAHD